MCVYETGKVINVQCLFKKIVGVEKFKAELPINQSV
jgi:hypothetical protein